MSANFNGRLCKLFLLITVIGVVHMGEQIVFGVEEYHMMRELVGRWHGLFPMSWADQASVLLITIIFSSVSLMLYAVMRGGAAGLIVIGLFGVLGVGEAHHWIEATMEQGYDPGLVTSFAFVCVGALIVAEVGLELRVPRRAAMPG